MKPITFNCGHRRTKANRSICRGKTICRKCYNAKMRAYMSPARRLAKLLTEAAAAKPHLYSTQQVA